MSKLNFLVFDTRSGSTFLASQLQSYPELGVTLESSLPFILLTGNSMYESSGDVDKLLDALYADKFRHYADKKFSEWGIDRPLLREKLLGKIPISNSDLLVLILDVYFQQVKKTAKFYIFKGVDLYLLKKVKSAFPDSKCVFIYRDGRAVYASKKRTINLNTGINMAHDPVAEARRWVRNFSLVKNAYSTEDVIFIRYEKLIEHTYNVIESVRRFISGDKAITSKIFESKIESYRRAIPDTQKELHPNIGNAPMPSRIDAWKDELIFPERYYYEKTSHKELSRWGYLATTYGNSLNFNQKLSLLKYFFILMGFRLKKNTVRLRMYFKDPILLFKRLMLRINVKE